MSRPGRRALRAGSWVLLLIGAALMAFAIVKGILAPTASETWAWVIVEFCALPLVVVGLHGAIEG